MRERVLVMLVTLGVVVWLALPAVAQILDDTTESVTEEVDQTTETVEETSDDLVSETEGALDDTTSTIEETAEETLEESSDDGSEEEAEPTDDSSTTADDTSTTSDDDGSSTGDTTEITSSTEESEVAESDESVASDEQQLTEDTAAHGEERLGGSTGAVAEGDDDDSGNGTGIRALAGSVSVLDPISSGTSRSSSEVETTVGFLQRALSWIAASDSMMMGVLAGPLIALEVLLRAIVSAGSGLVAPASLLGAYGFAAVWDRRGRLAAG